MLVDNNAIHVVHFCSEQPNIFQPDIYSNRMCIIFQIIFLVLEQHVFSTVLSHKWKNTGLNEIMLKKYKNTDS